MASRAATLTRQVVNRLARARACTDADDHAQAGNAKERDGSLAEDNIDDEEHDRQTKSELERGEHGGDGRAEVGGEIDEEEHEGCANQAHVK